MPLIVDEGNSKEALIQKMEEYKKKMTEYSNLVKYYTSCISREKELLSKNENLKNKYVNNVKETNEKIKELEDKKNAIVEIKKLCTTLCQEYKNNMSTYIKDAISDFENGGYISNNQILGGEKLYNIDKANDDIINLVEKLINNASEKIEEYQNNIDGNNEVLNSYNEYIESYEKQIETNNENIKKYSVELQKAQENYNYYSDLYNKIRKQLESLY